MGTDAYQCSVRCCYNLMEVCHPQIYCTIDLYLLLEIHFRLGLSEGITPGNQPTEVKPMIVAVWYNGAIYVCRGCGMSFSSKKFAADHKRKCAVPMHNMQKT
jgi:hypothetical protein